MPGPWQTRQEFLVDQALQAAISDPETIRQTRPAVPQYLFPPKEGFSKQEHTIFSVMNMNRYMPSARSWLSGMPVMQEAFENGEFSGSSRYSMGSLWGA